MRLSWLRRISKTEAKLEGVVCDVSMGDLREIDENTMEAERVPGQPGVRLRVSDT